MILPTSYASALLLLVVSFLCLGLWINTFKLAGPRWRFELYSVDFAIGAAVLSIVAAFTLGTLGPDLAFSDRLLVAGRSSQAFVLAAGVLFNLGNMLLLAAVSMLGISSAFPIAIGVALAIGSLLSFRTSNVLFLVSGAALTLVAVLVNIAACRLRDSAAARTSAPARPASAAPSTTAQVQGGVKVAAKPGLRVPPKAAKSKVGKGIFVALLSGAMLGFFYPIAERGMTGDLSLGPYAGMLLFAIGILLSTLLFDFYFLNIAIEGGPLTAGAYLQGRAPQHFLGFAGGGLWAAGGLTALLALGAGAQAGVPAYLKPILPLASVLLAVTCGLLAWKEFKNAPSNAKLALYSSAVLFACGLALIGFGVAS